MNAGFRVLSGGVLRHGVVSQLASAISYLFCPPCVAAGGMLFAAAVQPVGAWWLYAGTYIFFAVLGPLLILFWLIGQGQVADLDVTLRAERHKPFVAAVSGAGLAWIVLYALDAPPLLVHFASAHTAVISIVLVVTFYWKISVHAAGAAAVATLVSLVLDTTTIAVLPVLLVAWSRLHLGRHTLSQVLAGGCLGAGVFALLL